jgi:hypothetical protein
MARELTDGVLHFMALESLGPTPTTPQIAELVIKVVRELGQPALAREFERAGDRKRDREAGAEPAAVAGATEEKLGPASKEIKAWVEKGVSLRRLERQTAATSLREFSLKNAYSRDLALAHRNGLLTLSGLESPLALAGCVLPFYAGESSPPTNLASILGAFDRAAGLAHDFVVVDAPEYALLSGGTANPAIGEFIQALTAGARLAGLDLVINLNCRTAPAWAAGLAGGPLFSAIGNKPHSGNLVSVSTALLAHLREGLEPAALTRINIHLNAEDFGSDAATRLLDAAAQLPGAIPVTFTFDRPKEPISLAEGIDRRNQAALMAIGVHLPRLVEQAGKHPTAEQFVRKLGSLARLALSAAAQKRDFVKKHTLAEAEVRRGFLLDRARTVIVPVGLELVVQALAGASQWESSSALGLAKQILESLKTAVEQDSASYALEASLDSWRIEGQDDFLFAISPTRHHPLNSRDGLKAAGMLHASAGGGIAACCLPASDRPAKELLVQHLECAWRETRVRRLQFVPSEVQSHQSTAFG